MREKRKMLEDLFISSIEQHNPNGAAILPDLINEISQDISAAVGPINIATAPFVIALLGAYADSIKSEYPGIDTIVSQIKEAPLYQCKVVLPHG